MPKNSTTRKKTSKKLKKVDSTDLETSKNLPALGAPRKGGNQSRRVSVPVLTEETGTEYHPTKKQLEFLTAFLQNSGDSGSLHAKIKTIDIVHPATWYKWKRDKAFMEWFRAALDHYLTGYLTPLLEVGFDRAMKGDFRYWDAMMKQINLATELLGPTEKENKGVNISDANVQIVITDAKLGSRSNDED